jgi:cobalamin biosynthesis protein CobT
MAKRILNRKDLRADYEAAERRKEEDEDEDEEEGDDEASDEAEEEGESAGEGEDEDEEAAPKKKKKPVAKEAKAKAKPKRSRAAKQVRKRVVWGVFNNSNQCVAKFDYPKRREAEEHAAKLGAAKNPPQSFFIQPIKEDIEEK